MTLKNLTIDYVVKQLEMFVPDGYRAVDSIQLCYPEAMEKTKKCIASIISKKDLDFNYLVSWEYATFLYFLARILWVKTGESDTAVRIFLLNKALNGIDLFYEVKMPSYFILGGHTVGTVFAKACYSNYVVFHQGCTVGRNGEDRPVLDEGVIMFPGSMIIGKCHVKENTVLSPGAKLINTSSPGNCYVFEGKSGRPKFKELTVYYADRFFIRDNI